MRETRRVVLCIAVALLLAVPVMAQPATDGAGWWSWLAEGWDAVVRVFAADSEEPAEEPEAEPVEPEDAVLVCLPFVGCIEVEDDGDGGPSLDPNG